MAAEPVVDPKTAHRLSPAGAVDAAVALRLRVPKAAELVADELRRRIVRGHLTEGDALAPEAELMRQFSVSRPTLREAFRILESERLISVRRGARGGARVHMPDIRVAAQYAGLLLQVRGATLADVYEARLLIEPPLAGLLAARRPAGEIEQLHEVLAAEEAAIGKDPDALAALFTRFHQLVVEGAGNVTLALLAGMLANVAERHLAIEITSKRGRPEQEADNRRAYKAHRKLLDFVEAGDQLAAEEFWRSHMEIVRDYMFAEIGPMTVIDLLD